jgi:hypothetical protein
MVPGLLLPVEYPWQHPGLCHDDASTTNTSATSCRSPLRTVRTRHRVHGSSNLRTPRGALLLWIWR